MNDMAIKYRISIDRKRKNINTVRIDVSTKESNAEKGFYTIKFYLNKGENEFEIKHHSYNCSEENGSCVYNTGSEQFNLCGTNEGYVEFYLKTDSHNRERAIEEAMNKYGKFIDVWNIMGSIEAAGKALGGRSKKEVDEETFRTQLEWHNKIFQ